MLGKTGGRRGRVRGEAVAVRVATHKTFCYYTHRHREDTLYNTHSITFELRAERGAAAADVAACVRGWRVGGPPPET